MTVPGGLPEVLAAHCPRVATAIREALHGHPAYQPIRRAAGPMFGGRRETCARLLGLVLRRAPSPRTTAGASATSASSRPGRRSRCRCCRRRGTWPWPPRRGPAGRSRRPAASPRWPS
ncbi:hypothetical protein ACFQY7_02520 [Actinomadura luteofluorescens]|uniref:hypothetical protein n=1 Tax=Actinomadura luteofluorescens TaxID=46163 RepID=UPI00362EA9A9